ncbi:MAG: thioredoxin-disulfide reductase [bacterium]|nr:MAG: thioredoxin-disulfide reductase [bacterium]
MTDKIRDMVIIGGGPAGLTAGIYASRALLDVVLLEKGAYGGQMVTTAHIENYPGFPEGIGGFELADLMQKQAEVFGLPIQYRSVESVVREENSLVVNTGDGPVRTRTVIIATGATPNKLGVPGEERLTGRGVSYCATCDGALYRDRVVAVIGGGDSAVEEALFLTRFASRVHIVHRRDQLRAVPLSAQRALANEKITMEWNTVLREVKGDSDVQELLLEDVKSGQTRLLKADGVFIYVGITPQVGFVSHLVEMDAGGYVITDTGMRTSVQGVYAAGDVRSGSIRQVSSAVGDGATAAYNAYKYLEEKDSI